MMFLRTDSPEESVQEESVQEERAPEEKFLLVEEIHREDTLKPPVITEQIYTISQLANRWQLDREEIKTILEQQREELRDVLLTLDQLGQRWQLSQDEIIKILYAHDRTYYLPFMRLFGTRSGNDGIRVKLSHILAYEEISMADPGQKKRSGKPSITGERVKVKLRSKATKYMKRQQQEG